MARHTHAEACLKPRRRTPSTISVAGASRRSSQRPRLLGAITDLAVVDGYAAVTVGKVIARAGVSRATFYEYFEDLEECFAAALAPIRRRLLAGIRISVANDRAEHASLRAIRALFAYAGSRPASARLLLSDSLTGGSRLHSVREELIEAAARIIEDAHRRAAPNAILPDLPPWLLMAVCCRAVGSRLHDEEPNLRALQEDLRGWVAAYNTARAHHRWSTIAALPPAPRSPYLPPGSLRAPPALRTGQRRMAGTLADYQWSRIVFAAAEVIRRDGYSAATVAAITEVAGVEARVFYRLFAGKQQALAAARELLFGNAMAAAAGAFMAGESWPERLWEAARALTQFAEQNPTLTYVSLVDGQAGGASAIRPLEARTRAFTIFLLEGLAHVPGGPQGVRPDPSGVALEAIGLAVFELAYRHAREDYEAPLSMLLAPIVFISLTPFLGTDEAGEFVCMHTPQAVRREQLAGAA
ncbi:MAG TPA: TetR/AcrR family transcriptional regulator [Solirubrobacteraceae bacterium]